MKKFTPHSLRLRFILGTAIGLVLISMIYATVTVIGLNAFKLRSIRQQMAQEIELFMTFVDIKQGNLIVNAPEGRLRKKNYCIWIYSTDNKLLWSFKQGERVIDDPTTVLSVDAREFRIRERDGATTVFSRLTP